MTNDSETRFYICKAVDKKFYFECCFFLIASYQWTSIFSQAASSTDPDVFFLDGSDLWPLYIYTVYTCT